MQPRVLTTGDRKQQKLRGRERERSRSQLADATGLYASRVRLSPEASARALVFAVIACLLHGYGVQPGQFSDVYVHNCSL